MALSRAKMKKELLEKNFEDAENTGGREDDIRILPYYKLKTGEKLRVIFQPDEDGNLFRYFKKHGPNLKMPGAGTIDCIYHSSGVECPACKKGFALMNDVSKDEGKRWMAKDYYVAQCVVVDAPFELPERPEDHPARDNEMWIVYLPYKVYEKIKSDYREGLVDDPFGEVFVFKKTENKGGQASYDNSFFERNTEAQLAEMFNAFEDAQVDPYVLDGGIIPDPATTEEVEEWVAKVEKMQEKASASKSDQSGGASGNDKLRTSVGDRLKQQKVDETDKVDDNDSSDDDDSSEGSENSEPQEDKSPRERLGRSSLRDRIKR
jgi:hypothetical protein